MDFSYVFLTLHSLKYKEPYVVIERYAHIFRNPDTLAEMVARALTWALRDVCVEVVLEPWDTKGKVVPYLKDFWESYNLELYKCDGKNLIKMGYEDALEHHKKKKEAKSKGKKSDDIMYYIQHPNKKAIVAFIHKALVGMRLPKDIARPIRLLTDHGVFLDNDANRLPYKAFIKECPEVKDLISERKYNEWTNTNNSNYNNDDRYILLEKQLESALIG